MEKIYKFYSGPTQPQLILKLPFELRKKSRFRAVAISGEELGVILPRGRILRDGVLLEDDGGRVIAVHAAGEKVSTVRSDDLRLLARGAYHLGNRHVPLQVGDGWLRYQHDHVLDQMVVGLGFKLLIESAPFEPEDGAYGGGHRHHDGDHEHE